MLYAFLYILVTSGSLIIIHFIGSQMPDMLMIFLSTSYAIIAFNSINYKKIPTIYAALIKHKQIYAYLCFYMFIMWLGSFLIPIYFLPSTLPISYMSILGILGSFSLFKKTQSKLLLLKSLLISLNLGIFYLMFRFIYFGWHYWTFILATLITGIGGYLYIKASESFNKHGFSPSQILAVRFWLLWIFSLIYVIYDHQLSLLHLITIPKTLLVSFTSLIIPIYLFQKSVHKLGADKASILIGFTPCAVGILESFFIHSKNNLALIFAFSLAIILTLFYCIDLINQQKTANNP